MDLAVQRLLTSQALRSTAVLRTAAAPGDAGLEGLALNQTETRGRLSALDLWGRVQFPSTAVRSPAFPAGSSRQMRYRRVLMDTGNEHAKPRDVAAARQRFGRRPRLLVALLISVAILCHGTVVVAAPVTGSPAESLLTLSTENEAPPHAGTCTAGNEAVTVSPLRSGSVWASHVLGESSWRFVPDAAPVGARTPVVTCAPGVRLALLQVFRI